MLAAVTFALCATSGIAMQALLAPAESAWGPIENGAFILGLVAGAFVFRTTRRRPL